MSNRTERQRQASPFWKGRGGILTVVVIVFVATLAMIFVSNQPDASVGDETSPDSSVGDETSPSGYRFAVGSPGLGEAAPPLRLPAADGADFDLADQTDETVLLYFQEGLMCQPCFDQLAEIEASWDGFTELGIDTIASITTDPVDLLQQAGVDDAFTTPVLADPDRRVSEVWGTLDYGMMGGTHNGHSFIVVDPDGTIRWRADYGGAPDYTMYLPVPDLLTDLEEGLDAAG